MTDPKIKKYNKAIPKLIGISKNKKSTKTISGFKERSI